MRFSPFSLCRPRRYTRQKNQLETYAKHTSFVLVFTLSFFLFAFDCSASILYSADPFSGNLHEINQSTYQTVRSLTITDSEAGDILGFNGIAVYPPDQSIAYGILRISGNRILSRIDLRSGTATRIGTLGQNFSALSFGNNGTLYGITGDGASTPSSLFSIDLTNASTTLLASYVANSDGESLTYNKEDGKLYRGTGNDLYAIDPQDPANPVPIFENNTDLPGSAGALLHTTGNNLLWASQSELFSVDISTSQVVTLSSLDNGTKGLLLFPGFPSLVSFSPSHQSTNVAPDARFEVHFDQAVFSGSGSIAFKKTADNSVASSINIGSSAISGWGTQTISFAPSPPLPPDTSYFVTIDPAAIENADGLKFEGITSGSRWTFSVRPDTTTLQFSDDLATRNFIDTDLTTAPWDSLRGAYSLLLGTWNKLDGTPGYEQITQSEGSPPQIEVVVNSLGQYFKAWEVDTGMPETDIFFSRWDGSAWVKMDGTPGSDNLSNNPGYSLAPTIYFLPSGNPFVVWVDNTSGSSDIFFSRWNGSAWVTMDGTPGYQDVLPGTPLISGSPQVLFDSSENPLFLWYDYATGMGDLYFSRWNGSTWVKMDGTPGYENVNNTPGLTYYKFAFYLDAFDRPLISWQDTLLSQSDIFVTRWDGSAWVTMDGTPGRDNISNSSGESLFGEMILDTSKNPMILWYEDTILSFSKWDGSAWVTMDGTPGYESVSGTSQETAKAKILLQPSGNPIISWYKTIEAEIFCSRWDGSAWVTMDGTPGYGRVTQTDLASENYQMAIDPSGNPLIAWLGNDQSVNVTRWDGSAWMDMLGTREPNNISGGLLSYFQDPEIIFPPSGNPAISWYGSDFSYYLSLWDPTPVSPSTVQSTDITGLLSKPILTATLTATDSTPGASHIEYFLTNTGGATWLPVQKGVPVSFPTDGTDLRWKAVLFSGSVPRLSSVSISYTIPGSSQDSETKDTDIDLLSFEDLTSSSLSLRVRLSKDYRDKKLDFKIRIRNNDTKESFTVEVSKRTSKQGIAILPVSGLLADTSYSFRVKFSEKDEDNFSDYSNERDVRTPASVARSKAATPSPSPPSEAPSPKPDSSTDVSDTQSPTVENSHAEKTEREDSSAPETPSRVSGWRPAFSRFISSVSDSIVTRVALPIVGLVTSSVLGASTLLAGITFLAPQQFAGNSLSFIGLLFGIGKPKRKWGIVFDSQTKLPVPGTIVSLRDSRNNTLNTCVTDRDGRYGFFVNPGSYKLSILKGQYTISTDAPTDPLYGHLYRGETLSINDANLIIDENIALDPGGFNWQRFSEDAVRSHNSGVKRFLRFSSFSLFFLGLASAFVSVFAAFSLFGLLILSLYTVVLIFFWKNKRRYGIVSTNNDTPIPFAQIELQKESARTAFAITDLFGRYFLLVPPGQYRCFLRGVKRSGELFERETFLKLPDGILAKDWKI